MKWAINSPGGRPPFGRVGRRSNTSPARVCEHFPMTCEVLAEAGHAEIAFASKRGMGWRRFRGGSSPHLKTVEQNI